MNRVNISTTISLATRRDIDRLREDYGTISEVLTRAVALLAAEDRIVHTDAYGRLVHPATEPRQEPD